MSDTAGVADLLRALVMTRDDFGCDSVAASYMSPLGPLVTLTVYHSFATLTDDDGNVQAVSLEGIEQ